MRTRNYFKYLFATLFAANISGSVEAQSVQWNQGDVLYYWDKTNPSSYKLDSRKPSNDNTWRTEDISSSSISTNTTERISGSIDGNQSYLCTEIAKFKTSSHSNYRVVAQDITCSVVVPKFTVFYYKCLLAGNVTKDSQTRKYNLRYGFELVDFSNTDYSVKDITWDTYYTNENTTSVESFRGSGNPKVYMGTTLLRNGSKGTSDYVGENYQATLIFSNQGGRVSQTVTKNMGVMAYIYKDYSYSATATFGYTEEGYESIYRYYAQVKYFDNINPANQKQLTSDYNYAEGENGTFPLVGTTPTRDGYTFEGWSTSPTGSVEYRNGDDFCPYDKKDGGGRGNVYLYAVWKPIEYTVRFHTCGGKLSDNIGVKNGVGSLSEGNSVLEIKVQSDDSKGARFWCGNEITIRPGYLMLGWFTSPIKGKGECVYSVADGGCAFNAQKGTYWDNSGENASWVYWIPNDNNPVVNFYAQYEPKFNVSDDGETITFINLKEQQQYKDISSNLANISALDIDGAVKEAKMKTSVAPLVLDLKAIPDYFQPGMGFPVESMKYDGAGAFEYVLRQAKLDGTLSPNALAYLNDNNSLYTTYENVVKQEQCHNLVVTDRYSMKIPYGFNAKKATYERNKDQIGTNDAMWQQSYNSVWGTLCLPYPITNNHSYRDESGIDYQIRFYELYGTHDNYMQFREMAGNQKIEANTPVLYCRTAGVGSAVTVQESSSSGVEVPANIENGQYKVNSVLYSNELREEMKRNENAERVVEEDWQFKGTLETKKFCTKAYSDLCIQKGAQAEFLAGAEVLDPDNEKIPYREIYYFKQDKFTHMTSGVTILPYRAYFDRKKIEESTDQIGESKVSSYSILVMDDDGTTTDITNLIDNHEAKGNGKIYDLSGRRVKQPVKGSIYIVDGKKKMY